MRKVQSGQVGRASRSARLGASDPRNRRDAQQNTNNRDIGKGLKIDARGKLAADPRPLAAADVVGVLPSVITGPLRMKGGKLDVTPGARVDTPVVSPTSANLQAKLYETINALTAGGFLGG